MGLIKGDTRSLDYSSYGEMLIVAHMTEEGISLLPRRVEAGAYGLGLGI